MKSKSELFKLPEACYFCLNRSELLKKQKSDISSHDISLYVVSKWNPSGFNCFSMIFFMLQLVISCRNSFHSGKYFKLLNSFCTEATIYSVHRFLFSKLQIILHKQTVEILRNIVKCINRAHGTKIKVIKATSNCLTF